jgi:O-acetylserine/cysteine efflux transporter
VKSFDVFLAVLVAVIWGLGFVASRLALDELSPALMTAMRFAIAAAPCLFVRRPKVPWTVLIAISGTLFLGQFLAQSWAIAHGVPVGLASVIVQSQALFTVAFAAAAFCEIPARLPFALLVPFVGAGVSSVVFGETFGPLRLTGMLTVVGGIAIMLLSKRPQFLPKIA